MRTPEKMDAEGRTLNLPVRTKKPRKNGITAITDLGVPCGELADILENYHSFVDIAKLGIGSAYLEPALQKKISIYSEYGIPVYFGGTLFEKYFFQGKLDDYLFFLNKLGITWLEVSDGTITMKPDEFPAIISRLKDNFNVLAEVGKKDEAEDLKQEEWLSLTEQAIGAGCHYVVLEGRNTGDSGIYSADGTLRKQLVEKIIEVVNPERLIFEAPSTHSQSQLINVLGNNVNMGNIFLRNLLLMESQRQGLRSETFYI